MKNLLFFAFLVLCLAGCGFDLSPPTPDTYPLTVDYLSGLVKGKKPVFPPTRILVLLPADERQDLTVRGGTLPIARDMGEIVGIHGLSSQEGRVGIAARGHIPNLGVLRTMDSGIVYPPNIPKSVYALSDLSEVVQKAIATHFCEAGFHVETVPFSFPTPLTRKKKHADYALGCTIKEFSLLSLIRYQQFFISPYTSSVPIRGPTQAAVFLALSLYRWPSGEILWQGDIGDIVDDPVLGDSFHLYASAEEPLTMALSRTVGSILITRNLQDILLRPWLHNRPSLVVSPRCL